METDPVRSHFIIITVLDVVAGWLKRGYMRFPKFVDETLITRAPLMTLL